MRTCQTTLETSGEDGRCQLNFNFFGEFLAKKWWNSTSYECRKPRRCCGRCAWCSSEAYPWAVYGAWQLNWRSRCQVRQSPWKKIQKQTFSNIKVHLGRYVTYSDLSPTRVWPYSAVKWSVWRAFLKNQLRKIQRGISISIGLLENWISWIKRMPYPSGDQLTWKFLKKNPFSKSHRVGNRTASVLQVLKKIKIAVQFYKEISLKSINFWKYHFNVHQTEIVYTKSFGQNSNF